jgi:hypothetical protein
MTCDTEPTKISAKRWKSDSDNALKMRVNLSLGFESAWYLNDAWFGCSSTPTVLEEANRSNQLPGNSDYNS